MKEVELPALPADRFSELIDRADWTEFATKLEAARGRMGGHTLWHINSSARGGGVAEMLQSVLCYLVGSGINTRWGIIGGNRAFFQVTKRMHHLLHGAPGDGGSLGDPEMVAYEQALLPEADWLAEHLGPGDVAVLHDPQALGLAPALRRLGVQVIWSCHVGTDRPNSLTRDAWTQLLPYAEYVSSCVFSRPQYAWEGLRPSQVRVVPPCLDAFSPKNQLLGAQRRDGILQASGIVPGGDEASPEFVRQDGSTALVVRRARITEVAPTPRDATIVAQISRWDPLKDHLGVMNGFAEHVPQELGAHLILAGPDPEGVADDPEGQATHEELLSAWERLPTEARGRVHLACLPMEDLEQNAAMVNALQRRAQVVVQKSLAEGFGLTVAEAMWKARPVVGSRLGGIQDQIDGGYSGILVDDPSDLSELGAAISEILRDREEAEAMGRRAHERVRRDYLPPNYLGGYLELVAPERGR